MNLTEPRFLEIYHRQQKSDLSVKDFCSNEGIKESTFYYWRKKLAGKGQIKNFIPLVVKNSTPPVKPGYPNGSLRTCTPEATNDDFLLELVYTNGIKLRIKNDIDLARLRTLINLND
ncbi:IS66 family insertion sequence element accessory protein TnpB [Maribellus comscasis]|uniref:IS66 family insertion sequence element accessory protein TnpB n=1 Tax=Maribellus comscasis TaxID=2681766 RepID=A0A6I6JX40_9BACT|nr:IS66 family insertion sequence element accessory protein TnpB [Maribellus comscasis]QGY47706.1 IS66 family insertion sequence element accessory protein TnpB [Maribellus comscasis]